MFPVRSIAIRPQRTATSIGRRYCLRSCSPPCWDRCTPHSQGKGEPSSRTRGPDARRDAHPGPVPPGSTNGQVWIDSTVYPLPAEYRNHDGSGNNPVDGSRGEADTPLLRFTSIAYGDGANAPSGSNRPNARAISNAVCDQPADSINDVGAADMLWQWGQFVDHDIDLSPGGAHLTSGGVFRLGEAAEVRDGRFGAVWGAFCAVERPSAPDFGVAGV